MFFYDPAELRDLGIPVAQAQIDGWYDRPNYVLAGWHIPDPRSPLHGGCGEDHRLDLEDDSGEFQEVLWPVVVDIATESATREHAVLNRWGDEPLRFPTYIGEARTPEMERYGFDYGDIWDGPQPIRFWGAWPLTDGQAERMEKQSSKIWSCTPWEAVLSYCQIIGDSKFANCSEELLQAIVDGESRFQDGVMRIYDGQDDRLTAAFIEGNLNGLPPTREIPTFVDLSNLGEEAKIVAKDELKQLLVARGECPMDEDGDLLLRPDHYDPTPLLDEDLQVAWQQLLVVRAQVLASLPNFFAQQHPELFTDSDFYRRIDYTLGRERSMTQWD